MKRTEKKEGQHFPHFTNTHIGVVGRELYYIFVKVRSRWELLAIVPPIPKHFSLVGGVDYVDVSEALKQWYTKILEFIAISEQIVF